MGQRTPEQEPPRTGEADRWTRIDAAADPAAFVRTLDWARSLDTIVAQKELTYRLLAVGAGDRVLDVGCGTGDDVRALGRLVGPAGRVVGVDLSETVLAEARRRSAAEALPVEFRAGDAYALPFPDGGFDASRAERVLEHLREPERALAELRRVTRPGGRVVVVSPDTGSVTIDAPDRELVRKLVRFRDEDTSQKADGWTGRRLYGLCRAAGLTDLAVHAQTHVLLRPRSAGAFADRAAAAGAITAAEQAAWTQAMAVALQEDRFFFSTTHFIVAGRTPAPPAPAG